MKSFFSQVDANYNSPEWREHGAPTVPDRAILTASFGSAAVAELVHLVADTVDAQDGARFNSDRVRPDSVIILHGTAAEREGEWCRADAERAAIWADAERIEQALHAKWRGLGLRDVGTSDIAIALGMV